MIRTIRARLTLLFALILTTTLIVVSFVLYRLFNDTHQKEFDAALYNYTVDLVENLNFDIFGDLSFDSDIVYEENKVFPFSLGKALIQITTENGTVVARSRPLVKIRLPFKASEKPRFSDIDLGEGENLTTYRVVSTPIFKPLPAKLYLQVAVPRNFLAAEKQDLIQFFLFMIPLAAIISAFGGYYLSRKALDPVTSMINAANKIGAENLSDRVPVPAIQDEISHLAVTLNNLLERLDQAFKSLDRFISDASHQLKTPLAILKGELDLMRRSVHSEDELKSFFKSADQEITTLSKAVENLLLLARVDAGIGALTFSDFRLDETLIHEIERLERYSQARSVALKFNYENIKEGEDLDQAFTMHGDPYLLGEMFFNLIENAVKYSSAGDAVDIRLATSRKKFQVSIADQGRGIPPTQKQHIFERFVRVGNESEKGVGLGLAIAGKIASLHQGQIEVLENRPQGSVFQVELTRTIEN